MCDGSGTPATCGCDYSAKKEATLGGWTSAFLREQGWASQIQRHPRYGGKVLGICGGYQMLGQRIPRSHWGGTFFGQN
ncbi:MAG: hypothetical protein IPM37_07310 [Hahellaceae bacterium]|nr:hypothetical protein [Hahellaceae bacterium]